MNPRRISATVQYCVNTNHVVFNTVVDREWKTFGQEPVITPLQGVDAGIDLQRIDIGKKRVKEVVAKSWGLSLVEPEAIHEIPFGFVKDLDRHLTESRMSFFASAQSTYFAEPFFVRSSRARSTSACHAGDGTSFEERLRSSQISSIARSFSEIVIWSNGNVTSICPLLPYPTFLSRLSYCCEAKSARLELPPNCLLLVFSFLEDLSDAPSTGAPRHRCPAKPVDAYT